MYALYAALVALLVTKFNEEFFVSQYINEKENGTLHTAVIGIDGFGVEFQLRCFVHNEVAGNSYIEYELKFGNYKSACDFYTLAQHIDSLKAGKAIMDAVREYSDVYQQMKGVDIVGDVGF